MVKNCIREGVYLLTSQESTFTKEGGAIMAGVVW